VYKIIRVKFDKRGGIIYEKGYIGHLHRGINE